MPVAIGNDTTERRVPLEWRAPLEEMERRVRDDMQVLQCRSLLGACYAYVASHDAGCWLGRAWGHGSTPRAALQMALGRVYEDTHRVDATLTCIVVSGVGVIRTEDTQILADNTYRGVRGVGVLTAAGPSMASPTEALAYNIPPSKQLMQLAQTVGVTVTRLIHEGKVFTFEARQFHVSAGSDRVHEMLRGNVLVEEEDVFWERVAAFERQLSGWMLANVARNGRMAYGYHPSKSLDRSDNNMVRQWMATVCLGRLARRCSNTWATVVPEALADQAGESPRAVAQATANRNLRYNLHRFFRWRGELGCIENDGLIYLGSAALALIAIMESPLSETLGSEQTGLVATIDALSREDGSFQTFLKPKERTDNQNYFPGETLLAWAMLYRRTRSQRLLDRFMVSYRYYRHWHLTNRNPAFVPWHTQAYYELLRAEDVPELRDWIFEMNDWLVDTMQTRSRAVYDDTVGRFHDPHRPFGPPHASSTGVYLEGLVDAHSLATQLGQTERACRYASAIRMGLRSAMQLQFTDDLDMHYVSERSRVRGALRTSVYDNTIRVDNVQHVLMAVQKALD